MNTYYHCIPQEFVQGVLRKGIKPGKELGIRNFHLGMSVDNNYLYLWKNLGILQGELYRDLISSGLSFLSVEMPPEHPIERDLDTKILLMAKPEYLPLIFTMLDVPFDISEFMDVNALRKYQRSISHLPERERKRLIVDKVVKNLVADENALSTMLSKASVEKWDEVVGFYRTAQSIPPNRISIYNPQADPF